MWRGFTTTESRPDAYGRDPGQRREAALDEIGDPLARAVGHSGTKTDCRCVFRLYDGRLSVRTGKTDPVRPAPVYPVASAMRSLAMGGRAPATNRRKRGNQSLFVLPLPCKQPRRSGCG